MKTKYERDQKTFKKIRNRKRSGDGRQVGKILIKKPSKGDPSSKEKSEWYKSETAPKKTSNLVTSRAVHERTEGKKKFSDDRTSNL